MKDTRAYRITNRAETETPTQPTIWKASKEWYSKIVHAESFEIITTRDRLKT